MKTHKNIFIGLAFLFSILLIWALQPSFSSAATTNISRVRVTVCGDSVTEGAEQCDNGRQCSNGVNCSVDLDCAAIGDFLCNPRGGDGCSTTCTTESGGGGSSYVPPQLPVILSRITIRPEQRSLAYGDNYDADFYLKILNSDNSSHQMVYNHPSLLSVGASGSTLVSIALPDTFSFGVYDVLIKPLSHLTKIQDNVYLQAGDNDLNFTNPNNGVLIGSVTLTAGDIDPVGDNVINAVDLSVLLSRMGVTDPNGNTISANLNQDTTVDSADLSILAGNLDKEGDR